MRSETSKPSAGDGTSSASGSQTPPAPSAVSPKTLDETPREPKFLKGLFDKISEAVGATKELLYDRDLRRKAVPFVLSEGSKALQELQKGLTRNAQALGRQLQHSAAGQFPAYIGKLLERSAYSRRAGRAEQYAQPVSVWVGPDPCHDMPHEIRTRFWYVLLENPHLISLLGPISSQTLLTPSSPNETSEPIELNTAAVGGASAFAHATAAAAFAAGAASSFLATAATSTAADQQVAAAPFQPDQQPQPATSAVLPIGMPAQLEEAIERQNQATREDTAIASAGASLDALLDPVQGLEHVQGTTIAADAAMSQSSQEDEPTPAPCTSITLKPPSSMTDSSTTPRTVAPRMPRPSLDSAIPSDRNQPHPERTTTSFTAQNPMDASHAAEDDVLSFLEACQTGAGTTATPPASGRGELRASLSGFLQKVANVVDKGRASVNAARSTSGRDTPDAPDLAAPVDGPASASGGPFQRVSTTSGPGSQPPSQRPSIGNGPPPPPSQPSVAKSGPSQHVNQPTSPLAAMLSMISGPDGEWELLDSPRKSTDERENALNQAPSVAVQRLQRELDQSRMSNSTLEQVWSLMLTVPWEPGRGLVLDTPEDCRYLTLNEMTAGQEEVDDVIMRDIHRTFPEHPMFADMSGQMALFRLLKAYSLHDLEVGYCQGMAFMAGVMLMYLPEEPAFRLYCQVMSGDGPNLRRLYLPGLDELKSELERFEQLLSVTQPQLQAHLEAFGIPPVLYVSQWLMTVYASPFPPSFTAELVDIMIQDGHDAIMMRCALSIMDDLAPALLQLSDFEQLLTYIKVTPMEWDDIHLRKLLTTAIARQWIGSLPTGDLVSPSSLGDSASLALLLARADMLDTVPGMDGPSVIPDPGAPGLSTEGVMSEGHMRVSVGHMDAAELELDQEIAQMVRDLKLKVPSS